MTKYIAPALFALITAGVCAGQSQPESLGDVARGNNANKKAVLVVNEDTISSIGGTVSVVGGEPRQTGNFVAPASAKAPADKDPAVAAEGNAQVVELKKNLDKEKQQLQGWQQSAKHYEELLATEISDFRRGTYQSALANDRTNAALCQQKIDQVQADLAKAQQASGASGADRQPSKPPASGNQP